MSLYGLDYSGRIWSAASLEGVSLPPGDLRSNWPAAVAYFTDRSPRRLPERVDGHTLDVNKRYDNEMRDLAVATRRGQTSLVILDNAFLQIPASTKPLPETAPFAGLCNRVTPIVSICSTRR